MLDFLEKEKTFTGFGEDVSSAENSEEALDRAGLNWTIVQQDVFTKDTSGNMQIVPDMRCNLRLEDGKPLGIVSRRYRVCQNRDAFAFTDALIGSGVQYDRAGSFYGGRKIWLSAKLPTRSFMGDEVTPYLVFLNTHDGSGAVRVSITPHRIKCSNALNYAIRTSVRFWAVIHTADLSVRMDEAQNVLDMNEDYLIDLENMCRDLADKQIDDADLPALAAQIYPLPDGRDLTQRIRDNIDRKREQLLAVYREKEDLIDLPKTAWRFVNAVSDYATHGKPLNGTTRSASHVFEQVVDGHPLIDRAVRLFEQ